MTTNLKKKKSDLVRMINEPLPKQYQRIQCGDAFAIREDDWKPPHTKREWLSELLGGA